MAAPITGPYEKYLYLNGPPNYYGFKPKVLEEIRRSYKQRRPYDIPLDFLYSKKRVNAYSAHNTHTGSDTIYYMDTLGIPLKWDAQPELYNRVYEKFKEKIGSHVEAGIMLAEAKRSMTMIESRLTQLWRFTRALRRGKFGEAEEILVTSVGNRMSRRRWRPREGSKHFANNYLEFHFGWSPLLADIWDAAEVLSEPILPHYISVRSRNFESQPVRTVSDDGVDRHDTHELFDSDQTITLRAALEVLNPNLALRQQLGLVNPATIAWELVPFSFVVDWFINVGDFLSSFTDFAGVNLVRPSRTIFTRWRHSFQKESEYNYTNPTWSGPPNYYPFQRYSRSESYTRSSVVCERIVGLFPGPTLKIRSPWTVSARRGLAAASLLIQQIDRRF